MKPPGEAAPRSPLDKPLEELTEEDIAQLTREDCRRFLKSKGMRRPSWNKSQAIQQVISLKALLEGRPGCGDCPAGGGILQKPPLSYPTSSATSSPPQDSPPSLLKEGSGSQPPVKEPSPYRRKDQIPPPYPSGGPACRIPIAVADAHPPQENRSLSPRETVELPAATQMTIFYDGMVNVYDGVAADQARAVLELAASGVCFDDSPGSVSPARPPAFRAPSSLPGPAHAAPHFARCFPIWATGRVAHHVADGLEESRIPRETEPEGSSSRKASLQRYLEKRKDRFKFKKIVGGSTSNMEFMYYSQRLRCPNPNELTNMNGPSFPTLHDLPRSPARCSSAENQPQREKMFIDLNEDGTNRCTDFYQYRYSLDFRDFDLEFFGEGRANA